VGWQRKMMNQASTYEEVESASFVKSEAIDSTLLPAESRRPTSLSCWIYLMTISVAMLGWIWFLARIALMFVAAVFSF
jgi:hypothetical protein